jgi:hypothetical protein
MAGSVDVLSFGSGFEKFGYIGKTLGSGFFGKVSILLVSLALTSKGIFLFSPFIIFDKSSINQINFLMVNGSELVIYAIPDEYPTAIALQISLPNQKIE